LHGLGLFEDGSSDVVEDIGQLRRLPEHVNRGTFPYCVCYTHAKTLAEVVMTTQRCVSRTFGFCGGSLCIPLVDHATFVLVRRSVLTLACWTSVGAVDMVSDYNARKAFVAGKRPRASAGEHMTGPLGAASGQNAAVTKGAQPWVEWTKCGRRRRRSTNGSMNSRRRPAGPMSPTDRPRATRTPPPSRRRREPPRLRVSLATATQTVPRKRWTRRSCPSRVSTSPTADGADDGRLGTVGRRRRAGSPRVEPPRRGH